MEEQLKIQAELLMEQTHSIAGMHIFLCCLADELRASDPDLMSLVAARIREHDNPEREPGRQLNAINYALSLACPT